MKTSSIILLILSVLLLQTPFLSCKKYLDQKPSKDVVIPRRLSDLQALLDNWQEMNWKYHGMLDNVADDYYIKYADWVALFVEIRRMYIWDPNENISTLSAWANPYTVVYYSNVVLEQLPKMEDAGNTAIYRDIQGQALFFRSFAYWNVAQLFCRPYSTSAATDPGIVLRSTSDPNEPSVRSTVKQTYDQIIGDLEEAANLLPEVVIAPSRPNKAAAYGMLARVYLSMRDYTTAGIYAALCLERNSNLLDFNNLNSASVQPIPFPHNEISFWAIAANGGISSGSSVPTSEVRRIDSNLYRSYDSNDLRKEIYFQKNADDTTYRFKGSYGAGELNYDPFYGIASDEMYLIRAECYARAGNIDSALHYLNALLAKRWKTSTFSPVTAASAAEALEKILIERRKELVFRGLRWSDLRRLNLEGANISLTRELNGTNYTLPANDLRWVLLIPRDVIILSGIEQNPR